MKPSVYVITSTVDGRVYVGKSVDPEKRWEQHRSSARVGKAGPLYQAIREDGAAAFEFRVVETCGTEDAAFDAERQWVDRLSATDPERGFNRTIGGNGPAALSQQRYRHVTPEMCGELYQSGLTAPEIAKRLGFGSYQPVYRLLRRGGFTVRGAGRARKESASTERCWELYSQGLSLKAVGDRLGCSNQHVRRKLLAGGHRLRDARESHLTGAPK